MTEMCYASGINPSAIPGEDLDPDAVETAANGLSTGGGKVRDAGADVLTKWRGLSAHYEAPEAAQLFTVMNPVETKAREFGEAVTSVAGALRSYAAEIRPIKAGLDAVRADAWAFRESIASNAEWEYDQDLVDENTALVKRVNDLQVQLWEAERRCANAIRALYGAAPWRAMTSENDPLGYGAGEIPTDAAMPWGSEVQRKDHCPKSAAVGVKRFVWDGVVVDGLWGTVQGLGMLVGIDGTGWHWDTMKSSWIGMGSLIGYSGGEWSWDNAGEAWKGLGKGLISYDTWEDDPARAAGGSVFNIATIFIPAGAAVSGTKGAATAAGNAGRVSTLFAKGAKIVDFTDPVNLAIQGGKVVLPKLDDMVRGLGTTISDLTAAIDLPDIRTPDLDVPDATLDELLDGPPVREPELGGPDDVPAPQPAPEPALVGGGAPDGPGGLGHGADDLHQPPTTTPGPGTSTGGTSGGTGTDAPAGGTPDGPTTGSTTPGTTTGSTTPGTTTGSTTPGGTGSPETPGTGGTGSGTPGGTGGPDDLPGSGGTDDAVPGGTADPAPSDTPGVPGSESTTPGSSGDAPVRTVVDASGTAHEVRFADDMVTAQPTWEDALTRELADRGMSRGELDGLVSKPLNQLSRESLLTLIDIREAMPPIQPDDVIQKIIPPEQARNLLGVTYFDDLVEPAVLDHLRDASTWTRADGSPLVDMTAAPDSIGGFVARLADVADLDSTRLFHDLGLGYSNSTFVPEGSMFAIRTEAGDFPSSVVDPANPQAAVIEANQPLTVMREALYEPALDGSGRSRFDEITGLLDPDARSKAWQQFADERGAGYTMSQALDPANPHRGNGYGGTGQLFAPEFTYGLNRVEIPVGAEMWQIRPDGSRDVVAMFDGDRWIQVA